MLFSDILSPELNGKPSLVFCIFTNPFVDFVYNKPLTVFVKNDPHILLHCISMNSFVVFLYQLKVIQKFEKGFFLN